METDRQHFTRGHMILSRGQSQRLNGCFTLERETKSSKSVSSASRCRYFTAGVTPNMPMPGDTPPSGVTILRRSSRLMHSKMAEASNNQQPTKRAKKSDKSEKKPYPFRRKDIARVGVYRKFDIENMDPRDAHDVYGCATLAIQDYAIQNSQKWHNWHLLKIVEVVRVRVSGFRYYITFEAKNGHDDKHHTFQADVWNCSRFGRSIIGFRTLKPRSKWYSGKLWIPLTWSTSYIQPNYNVVEEIGIIYNTDLPKTENNELSPPEYMGEDQRNTYNKKGAEKSDEILAPGGCPVNLELDKSCDEDIGILEGCATLAMHDHLIQTLNTEWREWELIKIVTAYRSQNVSGDIYSLNFQIGNADSARTLEAEVFDDGKQRRVTHLRAIKPDVTKWYPGKLWIPI
ncbi:hypothetical protein P8452_24180 [Trifolium repens]|nr:hypothetical protein P8452_24180 [Trifolium repens]